MTTLAARVAREYGSPSVMIDLDVVARNVRRLQDACAEAGVANRPHVKTHKSPVIASIQRAAGAQGITCQKLGEAEVFRAGRLRRHPDQLQHPRPPTRSAASAPSWGRPR